jgi:hypothetical protein
VISNNKLDKTKLKLFQKSLKEIFSHFFCVTKSKSVLKMYQCANEIFSEMGSKKKCAENLHFPMEKILKKHRLDKKLKSVSDFFRLKIFQKTKPKNFFEFEFFQNFRKKCL